MSDEAQELTEAWYRAIGWYMAEFSLLVAEIRSHIVNRFQSPDDPPLLAEVALTGSTAGSLTNAFFTMCRMLAAHDVKEGRTAGVLKELIKAEIDFRNGVAHADWRRPIIKVVLGEQTTIETIPPGMSKIKRSSKGDSPRASIPNSLSARANEVVHLTELVREYGRVCFGTHPRQKAGEALRVRDVILLDGKRPVRAPRGT